MDIKNQFDHIALDEDLNFEGGDHIKDQTQSKKRKIVDIQKLKERGLNEIFNFYSKQHVMQGHKMTFDQIGKESTKLTLGDYIKLCSDFGITVPKETLTEIYRIKVKRGNQQLEFTTFKDCLTEIMAQHH